MKLIFNSDRKRFEWIADFNHKDIAKSAGFLWDKELRTVWYTAVAHTAVKLVEYADDETKKIIEKKLKQKPRKPRFQQIKKPTIPIEDLPADVWFDSKQALWDASAERTNPAQEPETYLSTDDDLDDFFWPDEDGVLWAREIEKLS